MTEADTHTGNQTNSDMDFIFYEDNLMNDAASSDGDLVLSIKKEVDTFFTSPRSSSVDDLSQIKNTKYLRLVFLKYNTPLPSSAHVERVFSFASKF